MYARRLCFSNVGMIRLKILSNAIRTCMRTLNKPRVSHSFVYSFSASSVRFFPFIHSFVFSPVAFYPATNAQSGWAQQSEFSTRSCRRLRCHTVSLFLFYYVITFLKWSSFLSIQVEQIATAYTVASLFTTT